MRGKLIGAPNQSVRIPALERRMPGVRHDLEPCFGPGLAKVPRGPDRADDVVAAMDDGCRDRPNMLNAVNQVAVAVQEGTLAQIMTFCPGQGEAMIVVGQAI